MAKERRLLNAWAYASVENFVQAENIARSAAMSGGRNGAAVDRAMRPRMMPENVA